MVSIAMFAMIGAAIDAGVAYWILFAVFALANTIRFVAKVVSD